MEYGKLEWLDIEGRNPETEGDTQEKAQKISIETPFKPSGN